MELYTYDPSTSEVGTGGLSKQFKASVCYIVSVRQKPKQQKDLSPWVRIEHLPTRSRFDQEYKVIFSYRANSKEPMPSETVSKTNS